MLRTLAFAIRFYFFSFSAGLVAIICGIYGLSQPAVNLSNDLIQAPNYNLIWSCMTVLGFILFINSIRKAMKDRQAIRDGVMREATTEL